MSYCRWSSDDFQCDVYVYADSRGGWTTHVASRRHVIDKPLPPVIELPPGFTDDHFMAWLERRGVVKAVLDAAPIVDIGLPYDGDDFNDSSPGECADRLVMLRTAGYQVPQYAIDELRSEHED